MRRIVRSALVAAVMSATAAIAAAQFGNGIAFQENFDAVTPPALPYGWVAANAQGPDPKWVTDTTDSDTAPNAAHVEDAAVSDKRLDSPPIAILTGGAQLSFRNRHLFYFDFPGGSPEHRGFDPEYFDGGVLEISIDGGDFQDILDAGGVFVEGGYVAEIIGPANPLIGRMGWVGGADYHTTTVTLPTAAAGATVVLRWRMGASGGSFGSPGWHIDGVRICDGFVCDAIPQPAGVNVDPAGNGVWEPGETVAIEPLYYNNGIPEPGFMTGVLGNFTGPPGTTLGIVDGNANYGAIPLGGVGGCAFIGDCYALTTDDGGTRPAQHWDTSIFEALSTGGGPVARALHVGGSFADVPTSDTFYKFVETVFHRGVTGGCGGTGYCPGAPALRKQMAVFLLKSKYGAAYVPPPAAGIFADVPTSDPFAPWIEDLYTLGVTGGCSSSPLQYCPEQTVLRKQMAVFLLKTAYGSDYLPSPCEGIFADVPCPSPFADWIEQLYASQIAAGCGNGNFCPDSPNTRGQMAVFLAKTFGMTLYGP